MVTKQVALLINGQAVVGIITLFLTTPPYRITNVCNDFLYFGLVNSIVAIAFTTAISVSSSRNALQTYTISL
ncbi:MAG: hypothetical protein RM049_37420 [Nostoc sp. DedQUE04]|uniref:hypothetical protein n=1 Tax=Nostoc sp. DedQUE04 TaxID=3075390 RepID=UPI002AD3A14C|nr:hypothetical protein [Nostoc sp. DedQUE04]MDZ8140908.1 hypothetical protein [Nostoc sp. DedQUE04]